MKINTKFELKIKTMFSYYGGKSKIIHKYPEAKHPLIIEPFAGGACYSLRFGKDKNVWLNDKYDVVYKIWEYLSKVSRKRIEELPHLKKGDDIRNFSLSQEEMYLIGFCVGSGRSSPGYKVTAFGDKTAYPREDSRWRPNSIWTLTRNRILKNLEMIKDWKITCLDFTEMENREGTYFVDVPYEFGGDLYVHNKINYNELSEWCETRKGQIIICENDKNTWLHKMGKLSNCHTIKMRGQKHTTNEVYLEIFN